jgi:uncharacterized protein (TIGR04255 family)
VSTKRVKDEPILRLKNAPIVEAVIDLDCEMPPLWQLKPVETAAKDSFRAQYPKFREVLLQEHRIEAQHEAESHVSSQSRLQGFQFLHEDERQLVQVRANGYSFNRLSPYSTLDDYIREIERTWKLFVSFASPVQVRAIRLRYINRILLPTSGGKLELADFFKICPHLPDEEKLVLVGFLNQHAAVEKDSGNQVNIILAGQALENNMIPVIFDITAATAMKTEPDNWGGIFASIQSLRHLKNRVFRNTLTSKCLNLFQR